MYLVVLKGLLLAITDGMKLKRKMPINLQN